ncbi:hypothetical protein [Haloquadratum walsbyi]|uniref:hypothetical protein n=1 Tax=Haloquadratum walsbyi TaxID=293091 RepID=UPI0013052608|nr:hypothetical protein [Haloquadratum walsbyi]
MNKGAKEPLQYERRYQYRERCPTEYEQRSRWLEIECESGVEREASISPQYLGDDSLACALLPDDCCRA